MIQFQIPLVNGTTDVPIELASHQEATFHTIKWKFTADPSAGTYSVLAKLTDGSYQQVEMRSDEKKLVSGNTLTFSGNIQGLRFILDGVTGGSGAVVSLWSYDQYPENGFPKGVFTGLRALTIQNYTEANVKNGVQYESSTYNPSVAANAVSYFVILTGSKGALIKGRTITVNGLGLKLETFVNPTYTGGTPIPIYNLNHKNPVPPTVTVLGNPTVTADGTKIACDKYILGTNPQGGVSVVSATLFTEAQGLETVLAPNSIYLFKSTSLETADTQAVFSYNTWYEGGIDLP